MTPAWRLFGLVVLTCAVAGCGGHRVAVSTNHGPPPPPPHLPDPSDSRESAPPLGPPIRLEGFGAWRLIREPALMFDRRVHATSISFRLNRRIDPHRDSAVVELNDARVEPQADGRGWQLRTRGNCYFAGAGKEGTTGRHDGDLARLTILIYRIRDHKMLARTSSAARLRGPLEQEDEPDNRWLHALGCGGSGYHAP